MELSWASVGESSELAALEAASYPADEAASEAVIRARIEQAPRCFLVAREAGALLGFVNGTRSAERRLRHAAMSSHDPTGVSLCVHSVVVAPERRREGLGSRLLAEYLERTRALEGVEQVLLISKEHLLDFYRAAGFELVGPSEVVAGRDPWFEMRRVLA